MLKNKDLFSGKLGVYPHKEFNLQLKPDAKPFHSKPYAVPRLHLETFKKELDRLVDIGVLVPTGASLWAAGTFVIPKKDGTVRFVTDFRQLNKHINRLQYPLPKIQDIIYTQQPYQFIKKLMFQCNIIPSIWTKSHQTYVLSLLLLESIVTQAFQWVFVNHLTLPKKQWKKF